MKLNPETPSLRFRPAVLAICLATLIVFLTTGFLRAEGVPIKVRVIEPVSGQPVANAKVYYLGPTTLYEHVTNYNKQPVLTDADGACTFQPKLNIGDDYWFVVEPVDLPYKLTRNFVYKGESEISQEIKLADKPYWIAGSLTDEQGLGIGKTFIMVMMDFNMTGTSGALPLWHLHTDENGQFMFGPVSPGKYELRISKKGFEIPNRVIRLPEDIPSGESVAMLDIACKSIPIPNQLKIEVLDNSGQRLSGCSVELENSQGFHGIASVNQCCPAVFESVPPGRALVGMRFEDKICLTEIEIRGEPEEKHVVTFVSGGNMSASGRATIVIKNKNGIPISNTRMEWRFYPNHELAKGKISYPMHATTDPNGIVQLADLPPGRGEVSMFGIDATSSDNEFTIEPGGHAYLTVLTRPAYEGPWVEASGIVMAPDGKPLPLVGIWLDTAQHGLEPHARTDADGKWRIARVKPEAHWKHRLVYKHPAYSSAIELSLMPDQLANRSVTLQSPRHVKIYLQRLPEPNSEAQILKRDDLKALMGNDTMLLHLSTQDQSFDYQVRTQRIDEDGGIIFEQAATNIPLYFRSYDYEINPAEVRWQANGKPFAIGPLTITANTPPTVVGILSMPTTPKPNAPLP